MSIFYDLKRAGFIVEMDDFGSGYSSLNMLKDMPVDILKIDMNFLSKSQNEYKAKTIVQNIIHLSEALGIGSLTEGVESPSQYQELSDMGYKMAPTRNTGSLGLGVKENGFWSVGADPTRNAYTYAW